jgi:CIC family chloride channel protein
MPKLKNILTKIHIWRYKHISERQFVYVLSVLVGFLAGLGTLVLKNLTFFFQDILEGNFIKEYSNSLYFIFPIVGLVLIFYIKKYLIKKEIGHGISTTLYSISKRSGIIEKYKMYASLITAPITVGFGGSVGFARTRSKYRSCLRFVCVSAVSYEYENPNAIDWLCNCWSHVLDV